MRNCVHCHQPIHQANSEWWHIYRGDRVKVDADTGCGTPEPYVGELRAQSARDAKRMNYGGEKYWLYLDDSEVAMHARFTEMGMVDTAERMLTRSISEALVGNDGD